MGKPKIGKNIAAAFFVLYRHIDAY